MEMHKIGYYGPRIRGTKVQIISDSEQFFIKVIAVAEIDVALCMMWAIEQVSHRKYNVTDFKDYIKESYVDDFEEDNPMLGSYESYLVIDLYGNIVSKKNTVCKK